MKNTLSSVDYALLKFLYKRGSLHKSELKKKFRSLSNSLEYRLEFLSSSGISYIYEECRSSLGPSGRIRTKNLETYTLSDSGRKAVEDYNTNRKEELRAMWTINAWLPILVSTVTTLIMFGLQWLLPQIIEWFSNNI